MKSELIENRIIKDNDIKVESEEVVNRTKELLSSQYSQYGMMIPADEELTKAAQNVLSNQEESRKIFDMMYDQKVMNFLKDSVGLSLRQSKELTTLMASSGRAAVLRMHSPMMLISEQYIKCL